jgi:hypothetical protein
MALRRILCTQCDGALEVDDSAKSVNCVHCNTRVITELLVVDAYVAVRRFTTANRMRITKKALVYSSVRADALEIEGFLQGEAVSLSGIRVSKSARVAANLRGAWLSVDAGASLVGEMRIGPDQVPEAGNLGG